MNVKRIALAVLVLGLIAIPMGVALAKEIGRVTISGPGLDKPIEITDHDLANQLGPGALDNFEAMLVKPATQPGDTYYTIDRDYVDEKGHVFATDHLRYYPDAKTGHGIVLYEGMDNGESSNAGRWFMAGSTGEAALLKILAENGVALTVAGKTVAKVEPVKAEPAKLEPAKVEPAKVEPARAEPAAAAAAEVTAPPVDAPASSLPLLLGGALILVLGVGVGLTVGRSRRSHASS